MLPTLHVEILSGVDLWCRTNLILRPPKEQTGPTEIPLRCAEATGLQTNSPTEEQKLQKFLQSEIPKFEHVHGLTPLAEHKIRLKPTKPIKQRYRPRNPAMQAIIDAEVDEMFSAGIIEKSKSAWSSTVVVVKKKDGSHRFCIDFRKVNNVSEKDAYPYRISPLRWKNYEGQNICPLST